MELSFSAPYTAMTRERERERGGWGGDRIQPRETGGGREERGQIKGRRTRGTVGTESGEKLRQMDGAGSGVKMKVKRSSEEENISGIDDVMSSCGPGSPQTTAQAQMLLNEASNTQRRHRSYLYAAGSERPSVDAKRFETQVSIHTHFDAVVAKARDMHPHTEGRAAGSEWGSISCSRTFGPHRSRNQTTKPPTGG